MDDQTTNSRYHILVVDDEPLIRKAYEDGLKRAGYRVDTAENGLQALEKLTQSQFHLVLLDIIMPEMDGFQVLQQIKQRPQLSGVLVVVLSVSGHESDIAKSKKNGAIDYLVKTEYSMKEIIQRIKFHLDE
jgi:two-component system response regulator ResD